MPEKPASLLGRCEMLRLDSEVEHLFRAMQNDCVAGNNEKLVYEPFPLPILTSLPSTLPRRYVQIDTGRDQKLASTEGLGVIVSPILEAQGGLGYFSVSNTLSGNGPSI